MSDVEPTSAAPVAVRGPGVPQLVGGVAVALGVVGAALDHWTCDDAFISLRYADNLVAGHGLVWNPGERVEGITNLLWTLLLAAGRAAGADARALAEGLGLAAWLGLLLAAWSWERRRYPEQLPWAVLLLAVMPDLRVWATGGLETMAAALAAMAQVLAVWRGRRWLSGCIAALAWLLRPDAVLAAGVVVAVDAALAWPDRRQALHRVLAGAGPMLLCVLATTLWRISYYGDPLPNPFWAKSAASGWWSQGLVYVGLALLTAWPVAIGLPWSALRARRLDRQDRLWIWGLAAAFAIQALYVAHSGGDFMHARRLVPVLPLAVLAVRLALPQDFDRHRLWALGVLGLASMPLPIFSLAPHGRVHGVADERHFYPREGMDLRIEQGKDLGSALAGVEAPLLISGGLCVLAWASGLPEIIEINGLTDRTIARQPVGERSLPGHEKHPTSAYLDQRGVSVVVLNATTQRGLGIDVAVNPKTQLYLALRYYDPAVLAALQRAGWSVPVIGEVLARADEAAAEAPCEVAGQLLAHFEGLLRAAAGDEVRHRWRATLAGRCEGGPRAAP